MNATLNIKFTVNSHNISAHPNIISLPYANYISAKEKINHLHCLTEIFFRSLQVPYRLMKHRYILM